MNKSDMICGCVEGFYGKPWTIDQRLKLFKLLREYSMNTYLYAPKDDSKHRAYWRDLYSIEEAEVLRDLIEQAKHEQIQFVYAISPGIDITYSSSKDQNILKRKLEQVRDLGCEHFSILFDDIDNEMQQPDKQNFNSFAEAQCYLANLLYEHLNTSGLFLFCPTEYCNQMIKNEKYTSFEESDYLKTIGEKLLKSIEIMWTGPKVISKELTNDHLDLVGKILKRKPLIWDNFHANDYDLKRVFMGAYCMRDPLIKNLISGILTNPNCEFECNYIPICSLGIWFQSRTQIIVEQDPLQVVSKTINRDYFTQDEFIIDKTNNFEYNIDKVIKFLINKWLVHFYDYQVANISIKNDDRLDQHEQEKIEIDQQLSSSNLNIKTKAQMDACNSLKSNNQTHKIQLLHNYKKRAKRKKRERIDGGEFYKLRSTNLQTSTHYHQHHKFKKQKLDSTLKSRLLNTKKKNISSLANATSCIEEPMEILNDFDNYSYYFIDDKIIESTEECTSKISHSRRSSISSLYSNYSYSSSHSNSIILSSKHISPMDLGYEECNSVTMPNFPNDTLIQSNEKLNEIDLKIIVDLFYLPFEYGSYAVYLLREFNSLKYDVFTLNNDDIKVSAWSQRVSLYLNVCNRIDKIVQKFQKLSNKQIQVELNTRLFEVNYQIQLTKSILEWIQLNFKDKTDKIMYLKEKKSINIEPWEYRGGFGSELRRVTSLELVNIPTEYFYGTSNTQIFKLQPYEPQQLHNSVSEFLNKNNNNLLTLIEKSPEMCFVIVDSYGKVQALAFCTFKLNDFTDMLPFYTNDLSTVDNISLCLLNVSLNVTSNVDLLLKLYQMVNLVLYSLKIQGSSEVSLVSHYNNDLIDKLLVDCGFYREFKINDDNSIQYYRHKFN